MEKMKGLGVTENKILGEINNLFIFKIYRLL